MKSEWNVPLAALDKSPLAPWGRALQDAVTAAASNRPHGDLANWLAALSALPALHASRIDLQSDHVTVGDRADADPLSLAQLETALRQLIPWRKGPFEVFGIGIDTEWRSDWKWRRLTPHIAPLAGRVVLDVGCGSGYHCSRMRGAGASWVLGVDPSWLYALQFAALQRYIQDPRVQVLPLQAEDLPHDMAVFDSVFSMGVLYHRRAPADHLRELHGLLRPGGELVLETLVLADENGRVLHPKRYAKMRNVWAIPSCPELLDWLRACGFSDARIVDVTGTTCAEQRRTEWMPFESLADFLLPGDPSRTLEGYPAPRRAIAIACRG